MEGKPDLIIGNYTDGNLVSSLMASKLGVTQVESITFLDLCMLIELAYILFLLHFELKLLILR